MDTKITKKRLNDHLSYDWVKYVAIIVATIFIFWLMYDIGATKPTSAQKLEIFILNGAANDDRLTRFYEDLEKRMNGTDPRPVDDRGYEVYHKDEILEITVSSFGNYRDDANVQQAVSVRMQGGQESDLLLMDYQNFNNYVQTWLVSLDDYKAALENALAEAEAAGKMEDPRVPDTATDRESLVKKLEYRLWTTLQEEYEIFFVRETEVVTAEDLEGITEADPLYGKAEGDPCTRYEKFAYRHQKVLPEGLERWQELSETLQQKINSLGDPTADNKDEYDAAIAEFNAGYAELPKEEEKAWGLDIDKFDRVNVQENWFTTQYEEYRREWGEDSDTGMYFALGLTNFPEINGTTYYELVKVFNFLIDNYAYPQTDA